MNEHWRKEDLLFTALAAGEPPALPVGLADRALKRARAHLALRGGARGKVSSAESALLPRLVPALLASSALVYAVGAFVQIARVFGSR